MDIQLLKAGGLFSTESISSLGKNSQLVFEDGYGIINVSVKVCFDYFVYFQMIRGSTPPSGYNVDDFTGIRTRSATRLDAGMPRQLKDVSRT